MKTKMTKKPLKKAQTGTVMGSEQGKGAKALRAAGKIIPTVGAAALATKAAINKIKNKRTQKRLEEEYMNETQRKNAEEAKEFQKGGSKINEQTIRKGTGTLTRRTVTYPGGEKTVQLTGKTSYGNPINKDAVFSGKPSDMTRANKKFEAQATTNKKASDIAKKTKALVAKKTGGMVNPNAKVSALKSAGSKGVKSGVNPKAAKQTTARGWSGGTSKAPTGATPTAKRGGMMRTKKK